MSDRMSVSAANIPDMGREKKIQKTGYVLLAIKIDPTVPLKRSSDNLSIACGKMKDAGLRVGTEYIRTEVIKQTHLFFSIRTEDYSEAEAVSVSTGFLDCSSALAQDKNMMHSRLLEYTSYIACSVRR